MWNFYSNCKSFCKVEPMLNPLHKLPESPPALRHPPPPLTTPLHTYTQPSNSAQRPSYPYTRTLPPPPSRLCPPPRLPTRNFCPPNITANNFVGGRDQKLMSANSSNGWWGVEPTSRKCIRPSLNPIMTKGMRFCEGVKLFLKALCPFFAAILTHFLNEKYFSLNVYKINYCVFDPSREENYTSFF